MSLWLACSVGKLETKKEKKKAETEEFSLKNVLKTYSNMTVLQYKTSYLFLAQNKQQQVGKNKTAFVLVLECSVNFTVC